MYIKDKKIKRMKTIGIIFTVIGVLNVAIAVWILVSLISHYRDNLETVLYAKATPDSVSSIITGSILLWLAFKIKEMIEGANFFSSYFEGDLDGYVTYKDLAEVMGKRESKIKRQLHILRKKCMKNFELQKIAGVEQVVLNSKKYMCECKNCGAPIEKSIYFTGTCSYCGSSDLFAKVMTDNRFYCIDNTVSKGVKRPAYYAVENLQNKKVLFIVLLSIGLFVMAIMAMMGIDNIAKYNDKEYLIEVLLSGESYSSFDLIKKEIMDTILISIVFVLALIPVVINRGRRIFYVYVADTYSEFFSRCKTPFVKAEALPAADNRKSGRKKAMKAVRGALKRRYLLNCTLEKHEDELMVVLAKQIVKDQCPSCGGAIVGAVDEHYKCRYCNNMIMDVIRKR